MPELARRGACIMVAVCAMSVGLPTVAGAHVHGITPLRCTPAPAVAGANGTNGTPASAGLGGPIPAAVPIPIGNGGNVDLFGGGFHAAVCD